MSYVLIRDRQYISAGPDHQDDQLIPCPILLCDDTASAWLSSTIEQALERSALLRICWGISTEIRALR